MICVEQLMKIINVHAISRKLVLLRIFIFMPQFDFDLDETLAIIAAVADPDMV